MLKKRTLWVTTTAVFISLIIGVQMATAAFGQLVTGSLVNLILALSVISCGPASGMTVAMVSPVFAYFFGISPLLPLIPFIMAGNAAYILIWHIAGKMKFANSLINLCSTCT
jgi:hypothetical protein